MTPDLKYCPGCNQDKPRVDFYRNRRNGDGLQSACKPCQSKANQLSRRAHWDAHRERVKDKQRAWKMVLRAVKAGRLTRPDQCEHCGSDEGVMQGHHKDYALPLDVEWLCGLCHRARHRPDSLPVATRAGITSALEGSDA